MRRNRPIAIILIFMLIINSILFIEVKADQTELNVNADVNSASENSTEDDNKLVDHADTKINSEEKVESEIDSDENQDDIEDMDDQMIDNNPAFTGKGQGTETDPYVIKTEEDLSSISDLDGFFELADDLVMTSENWTPIHNFKGTLDGKNHTISGLKISQSNTVNIGLIESIYNNGTVKNLTIEGTNEGGTSSSGILCAQNNGTIENCHSKGMNLGNGYYVGGLVGNNASIIMDSSSEAKVVGSKDGGYVGGLVGYSYGGSSKFIDGCFATGNVENRGNGTYTAAGGLVGYNNMPLSNCYERGNVTAGAGRTGGLVGTNNDYNSNISFCYATGVVSGTGNVGGLVGMGKASEIAYSYYNQIYTGNKIGNRCSNQQLKDKDTYYGWDFSQVWDINEAENDGYPYINRNPHGTAINYLPSGGIGTYGNPYQLNNEMQIFGIACGKLSVDNNAYFELTNDIELTAMNWDPIPEFKGNLDGKGHIISGLKISMKDNEDIGLIGVNKGTITNLTVDGTVEGGTSKAGILCGENNGTIENCHTKGTNLGNVYYVGGLVGYNTKTIKDSSSEVKAVGSKSDGYVGGLVGQNDYSSAIIDGCSATGEVVSIANGSYAAAGGLVGQNYAKITNSYATGSVKADSCRAGGLVGYNSDNKISYCYATNTVTGTGVTGGLVGYGNPNYIEYCYYNGQNTGNKLGNRCSLEQLKQQKTYYGWDFSQVWDIKADYNGGFPYINRTLHGDPSTLQISGAGSFTDPYQLNNEQQIFAIANGMLPVDSNTYLMLNNDIELTSVNWDPIYEFKGNLDGNGHTISGLQIGMKDYDRVGLIGLNSGTIKNLTVEGNIEGGTGKAGNLCAENNGTIENCHSKGVNQGSGYNVGGLVGYNYRVVSDCSSEVKVTACKKDSYAGGLVGYNTGKITNSFARGDVTVGSGRAGGLAGLNSSGAKISYCFAIGVVSGTGYTGGLVGSSMPQDVQFCYYNNVNTGNKLGNGCTLAQLKKQNTYYGWDFSQIWDINETTNDGYPFINCILHGTPDTSYQLNGTGSSFDPYQIENEQQIFAIASGKVTVDTNTYLVLNNDIQLTAINWDPIYEFSGNMDGKGHTISGLQIGMKDYERIGLIGLNNGTIKNLNVIGTMDGGTSKAGILCGENNGTIENCHTSGTNLGSGYQVGGLVGYNAKVIKDSSSEAKVVGGKNSIYVGGLVGYSYGTSATIDGSYATGEVEGNSSGQNVATGGLIGYNDSILTNCYARGNVSGCSGKAGGLVGLNYSKKISFCYATGLVSGNAAKGGLIGLSNPTDAIESCYYNNTNAGNGIGTGCSIQQLRTQQTFVGWDFADKWGIYPTLNGGFPYLQKQKDRMVETIIKVESISLNIKQTKIMAGDTINLLATVTPVDAMDQSVSWTSSDENVATVNNGLVSAKAGGTVVITATSIDGSNKSDSCTIIVEEKPPVYQEQAVAVNQVKLSGISKKIAAGKKIKLTSTILPGNASNKELTWSSSNKKYATVTQNGTVTVKKAGAGKSVKITAMAKDGSNTKAVYKITIMKHAVKSVNLKSSVKSLKVGKSTKLKATVKTTGKKANTSLKWTCSNTKYATVDQKGKVKAKKAGKGKTITITVISTDGTNKKAKVKLKIK